MRIPGIVFFAALLLVLFVPPSLFSAIDQTQKKMNYTIGPEDVLEIQVLGRDELQRTIEVSQEGNISFPLIGRIMAYGRTPLELENDIEQKLAEKEYLGAQVSIEIKRYGSLKVHLLGEVKKPGRYFLKGRTHVFSILAEAGGLTENAGSTILIIRSGADPGTKQLTDAQQTLTREILAIDLDDIITGKKTDLSYVLPGDTIKVPEAPRFYVTGEVKKAGEFKWEKQLSVRRAIAMAGGPTKAGASGRTSIQRFENSAEIEFQPEMTDMVQPNDIIIIPQSYF